jgi:hypothetical protein
MILWHGPEPPTLYATATAWGNYPELVGLTLRSHGRCVQKLSLRKKILFHKGFSKSSRCPSSEHIPGDNGNGLIVAPRSTPFNDSSDHILKRKNETISLWIQGRTTLGRSFRGKVGLTLPSHVMVRRQLIYDGIRHDVLIRENLLRRRIT